MTNHETVAYTPPSARQLLHDHGLPEDVIDGVLCLHAQELAATIRSHPGAIPYRPQLDEDGGFWWDTRDRDAAADLIDPTRAAAVSVPPPASQAAARRARYAAAIAEGFRAFDADTTSDAYLDAELLDAVVAVADAEEAELLAAVPVVPPATNRAALRDRIRRAVCEAEGFGWDTDMLEPDEYGEVADAVLAVLPEPADRAAVLNEGADAVFALDYDVMVGEEGDENLGSMREAWDLGTIHAEKLLRRLADEAQQPDDGEGDELVCVDECGFCDACGYEPFGTPAEGWREAARFLRRTARDSGDRQGALHGARLIEAELRRLADESGPCVAGEQQNEAPRRSRTARFLDALTHSGPGYDLTPAETPEARRCACPHPADEHSVYGCVDGCGCEWMPKRAAKGA